MRIAGALLSAAMLCGAPIGTHAETRVPAQLAPPPPASAFGRLPAVQSASISPDGVSVALVGGTADKRFLSIAELDKPNPLVLDLGNVRTSWVQWAGDGYFLVRVTKYGKPDWSKYAYNYTRDLVFDRGGVLKGWLLNKTPESGAYVSFPLLKVVGGDKPTVYVDAGALFKVDVASGRGSVISREEAGDWALDMSGSPKARIGLTTMGAVLQVRQGVGWATVATTKDRGVNVLGYSDPEDAVYFTQEDGEGGLLRLRKVTLADRKVTIVGADKPAGELGVGFDPYTGQAVVIGRTTDATEYEWLDAKLAANYAAMRKAMKGQDVEVMSWSRDRSRIVVRTVSADAPASWRLFDAGRRELSVLGDEYPELKGAALGRKSFITYKARDGLQLNAYLHLPPGGKTRDLPLVVLPHGGPEARDDHEFDWWAQFLATRGYAVLQPQFRGSDGFGYDLRRAGKQEWAGKMQTDLLDGIAALAAQGLADPKRVCIVGASYGGYAALEGMTGHPQAYRCGVAVNGISDPGLFVNELSRMFTIGAGGLSGTFGDNRKEIASATPATHAAAVEGPILLIHSAQDTTVPPEQSAVMAERLRAAGKTVETVELPGDDHHLMTSASRVRMLQAIEGFLARNLPAG